MSHLVSVVVVSYNAGKTILDTLESIKSQSYDNVELVVSDDCSRDNTVEVCRKWMDINHGRFVKTKLLVAERNQGICQNINKACRETDGEWIKMIAADDILLPNCIEDYVGFCSANHIIQFATSYIRVYNESFQDKNLMQSRVCPAPSGFFDLDAAGQLEIMYFTNCVSAPSMFFSKGLYESVGGFDERFAYEDHPFYINVLEHGNKLFFMPIETVGYRQHDSTFNSSEAIYNLKFMKASHYFRLTKCWDHYCFRQKLALRFRWCAEDVMDVLGMNRRKRFNLFVYDRVLKLSQIVSK